MYHMVPNHVMSDVTENTRPTDGGADAYIGLCCSLSRQSDLEKKSYGGRRTGRTAEGRSMYRTGDEPP